MLGCGSGVRADGTGLVYAGYIGGAGPDHRGASAVDAAGSAYVTGYTASDQTTFPVTVGPDLTFNGGELALNGGTITTPNTLTINSVISGNAGLNKLGAGTLNLTGANTYSGTTLIYNAASAATRFPF